MAVAALMLLATACQYDPAALAGNPALSECAGEPATIGIGWHEPADGPSGSSYDATGGDDVVVVTNGPVTLDALGGDDLICVNETNLAWGDETPSVEVQAGSGSDTIHNLSPDPDLFVLARLGGRYGPDGSPDTYHGGPAAEAVLQVAEGDWVSTGAGDDSVWAIPGPLHIDCGDGIDWVVYGALGPPDPDVMFNCENLVPFSIGLSTTPATS